MDTLRFFVIVLCGLGLLVYASAYISAFLGLDSRPRDEYDRIREYILNDSPLQGNIRPIIWVHTTYEVNARNWKSTVFRNSSDLNQAYLVATVQSIIDKCGNDFHICLIDDASFANLIPTWNETQASVISWGPLSSQTNPVNSYLRELGMLQLLYFYGGIRVPNSFLCLKSLMPLYKAYQGKEADRVASFSGKHAEESRHDEEENGYAEDANQDTKDVLPFVVEIQDGMWGPRNVTTTTVGDHRVSPSLKQPASSLTKSTKSSPGCTFVPTAQFMGSAKHSKVVKRWATLLRSQLNGGQFSSEIDFNRDVDRNIRIGDVHVFDGRLVGTRMNDGAPVAIEQLMSTTPLDLADDAYGVWIPEKKLLQSTKYRWFAHLSYPEIINGKTALSRLFAGW